MNVLIVLPLIIPLTAAAASTVFWRWPQAQRWIAVAGSAGLLAAAIALFISVNGNGIQATQMGNWPAPFGITLVVDLFSAIMLLVTGFMGLVTTIYSLGSIDARRESFGYYPLLQVLLMGVCGIFLTGDIFNLYVWLEVTLIASFVLMALGGETPQLKGAITYVVLNLIGSVTLLTAIGILYGAAGTLNMADLSQVLKNSPEPGLVVTMACFSWWLSASRPPPSPSFSGCRILTILLRRR